MFERFTDRARRVIVIAQDEARSLGHSRIRPEHLLLGLLKGDGVAATALGQSGAEYETVRPKVAEMVEASQKARSLDKVPFSPQAKKALEQSLRAALKLGHNYIGTEHLLLGVLRGADARDSRIKEVLGVDLDRLRARVMDLLSTGSPETTLRSPAVRAAVDRARQVAGPAAITTGHLVTAILADADSQATRALGTLSVTRESFAASVTEVDPATTSDATPGPQAFTLSIAGATTVIHDPELAATLKALTAEQLRATLRHALAPDPGSAASGSEV